MLLIKNIHLFYLHVILYIYYRKFKLIKTLKSDIME